MRLIAALSGETPTPKKLVVHRRPDTDAWSCVYLAHKHIPGAKNAEIVFVKAGELLPGSENDPTIIHFDTGGGDYDQHGRGLANSCSARILMERLGVKDAAAEPLLALATAVDNVNRVDPTSIHYVIEGMPYHFNVAGKGPDWKTIQQRVFEMFDILYNQEAGRIEARKLLDTIAVWVTLSNGLRIAYLGKEARCREAAFERGAAVVVWVTYRGQFKQVGIQVNRAYPELSLTNVAIALRQAEARAHNMPVTTEDFRGPGMKLCWFLHDSGRLVACGTRTHPVTSKEEETLGSPEDIWRLTQQAIEAIPPTLVYRWSNKGASH